MAHGKWSEVEARGVLEAWRQSGLPLERFARQRGFVAQPLHWGMRKLARAEKAVAVATAPSAAAGACERGAARRGEPVTVLLRPGHMLKVHGFDEKGPAPVAQEVLDLITELYRVEHDAKEQRLSEAAHLKLRKQRAAPIRERFQAWLETQRARHPPNSPLRIATRYGR